MLLDRLIHRPFSRIGKMAALFMNITDISEHDASVTPSPPQDITKHVLPIYLTIPDIHKKSDMPVSAIFQLAQSHMFERFLEYLQVFTDASVHRDGQGASAAFFCPSTQVRRIFHIPHPASSTTGCCTEIRARGVNHTEDCHIYGLPRCP